MTRPYNAAGMQDPLLSPVEKAVLAAMTHQLQEQAAAQEAEYLVDITKPVEFFDETGVSKKTLRMTGVIHAQGDDVVCNAHFDNGQQHLVVFDRGTGEVLISRFEGWYARQA